MNTFQWQYPWVLWALALVPFFYVFIAVSVWQNARFLKQVNKLTQTHLIIGANTPQAIIQGCLVSILFALVVLMIANPKRLQPVGEQPVQNKLLVYVLDISRSMDAPDILPSRLLAAKKAIESIRGKVTPETEALIIFAGNAVVQMPPTTDAQALSLYLANLQSSDMPLQGTNIPAALELAWQVCKPYTNTGKAIVLLSDGENHEETTPLLLDSLQAAQIPIAAIGFGTPQGAKIPASQDGFTITSNDGKPVETKLNTQTLQQYAQQTNGIYALFANDASIASVTNFLATNTWVQKQATKKAWQSWQPNLAILILVIAFIWWLVPRVNKFFFGTLVLLFVSSLGFTQSANTAYDLVQKGFTQQAITAYKRLVISDSSFENHYNLGTLLLQSADFSGSQNQLLKATKIQENNFNAWYNAGLAFAGTKSWEKAAACFQKSIVINATNLQARENLQWVLNQLKQNKQTQNKLPPKPKTDNAIPLTKVMSYEQEAAQQRKAPAPASKTLEKGW